MPRNASGVYSLPQAAFVPNTTISSTAVNSNFSDIATALSQSIATTGVTPLTGSLLATSGAVNAPGYAFASATSTGFYLPGANQMGWSSNGVQAATFNSDLSVTWLGAASWAGATTFTGTSTHNGASVFGASAMTINATSITFNATGLQSFWTGLASNAAIEFVIDGGGAQMQTGQKGHLEVPFNCTIKRNTLMADQTGSIVVNIWKTPFNTFPPTSGNKITSATPPTLTGAQSSQDSTLSGWTTALSAGDILAYNVDSVTSITRVTLSLLVQRTGS